MFHKAAVELRGQKQGKLSYRDNKFVQGANQKPWKGQIQGFFRHSRRRHYIRQSTALAIHLRQKCYLHELDRDHLIAAPH